MRHFARALQNNIIKWVFWYPGAEILMEEFYEQMGNDNPILKGLEWRSEKVLGVWISALEEATV